MRIGGAPAQVADKRLLQTKFQHRTALAWLKGAYSHASCESPHRLSRLVCVTAQMVIQKNRDHLMLDREVVLHVEAAQTELGIAMNGSGCMSYKLIPIDPNAIGYMEQNQVDDTVKVILSQ